MHREHLVVFPVGKNRHVMIPELGTDEQCFNAANNEKEEGGKTIHQTNLFVIDGGEPVHQSGCVLTRSGEDLGFNLVFSVWGEVLNRFSSHGKIWLGGFGIKDFRIGQVSKRSIDLLSRRHFQGFVRGGGHPHLPHSTLNYQI